ncbi:ATP-dependent protease LonB [Paradesulfitobacterium aromaticivorans]
MKGFDSTAEIPVPECLVDQVIGQEEAVQIIKLAAKQKRSVLLLGEPGTGKSLLASAMAELLPPEELKDVICLPNREQRTQPLIQIVNSGASEKLLQEAKEKFKRQGFSLNFLLIFAVVAISFVSFFYTLTRNNFYYLLGGLFLVLLIYGLKKRYLAQGQAPKFKILINNSGKKHAPVIDATGFHAGALLGDVRHDPFQSGGVETPPYQLIEAGAIHQAHKGILFIDEVSTLSMESQQSLLTAFQEKKLAITGRSLGSSGTMVRSEPVPCDFLLVLAGNLEDMDKMHPALRSRIRGYGYEIYMKEEIEDNELNRYKLAQFIAQEVNKDGKIPHFSYGAYLELLVEAGLMCSVKGKLTTKFRELGGLIRAAGDLARQDKVNLVEGIHVQNARELVLPLEKQLARSRARSLQSSVFLTDGRRIGQVNGVVCVDGIEPVIQPVWAVLSERPLRKEDAAGNHSITGDISLLGFSAPANLKNVLHAVLGRTLTGKELYLEIDRHYRNFSWEECPLAAVLAAKSALQQKAVNQGTAVLGGVNIKGEVLPTSLLQYKLAMLATAGIKQVLIPQVNEGDLPGQTTMRICLVATVEEAWTLL